MSIMMYDAILARSFSKHEQKKFGYGALVACFFVIFTFFTVVKPFISPLPSLHSLRLSMGDGLKMLMVEDTNASDQILEEVEVVTTNITQPICNFMEKTDFCDINKNVRIVGNSSSIFIDSNQMNSSWIIRPYARKQDQTAMSHVREWTVKSIDKQLKMTQCTKYHTVPAILFSTAGYCGNHFHDFTDVIVPLFVTARKFDGEVKFLITDRREWWVEKFKTILQSLSKYEIIDIDKETEQVHCFPSGIIGLNRHEKELSIDPIRHALTMTEFKDFLRKSYNLKRKKAIRIDDNNNKKPQLLVISRKRTRSFTNAKKIIQMGRRLGFKVKITEPDSNITRVAETVNSCDVMMGVHGAGLTNIVFLPQNAVFIQITPFGGVDWLSKNFFGDPSMAMNLKYLEYKISVEESSLIQQYSRDDDVLKNPTMISKKGWGAFKSIYLEKQNVNLNVDRFRPTLMRALELLRQ